MPRSRDPRSKLPSQRGAKRTGPIGTILPGDDVEVARDIQRIWWELRRRPQPPVRAEGNVGVPIESAYKIAGAGLQYWYRLGEPGPFPVGATNTSNFALDSSGNDRHLAAINENNDASAVMISDPASVNLPTCDVTGALTGGNANDGGIRFNLNAFEWTSWGAKLALIALSGSTPIESVGAVGTGSTFATWIAYEPVGPGDGFAPGDSTSVKLLVSTYVHVFGGSTNGVRIGFRPSDGVLFYNTYNASTGAGYAWQSDFSFVVDQWYHFAVSIERLTTTLYRRCFYINSNLILEVIGTVAETGPAGSGTTLSLGGGNDDDLRWGFGRGKLDEMAMWTSVLTQAQITDLWNARVLNEGDTWGNTPTLPNILIEKGDLATRNSAEVARLAVGANGKVLTADSTVALGLKWANGYHPPNTLPVLPHTPTAQDIADALVALGLVTQL